MVIRPHQYQDDAIDSVFTYFESGKTGNPVVAMPTGTGKSVVIGGLLERIFKRWPGQKILCLTHVKELIRQNYAKLLAMWPTAPAGVNSAGLRQRDTLHPIIFGGIGSVSKFAASFGHVDLLLIDEAHLVSPEDDTMYRAFINDLLAINPNLKVIGFTATPWRMGLGKLTEGELFTDFCFDITGMEAFNWLIHEGYLCPLIPKRTETVLDVDGVRMRGNDFIASELQQAVDRNELTERACQEAIEYAAGERHHWLGFCAGIEHAIHTADILNALGVPSIAIHNKMDNRDKAIAAWKSGQFQCAVSNNMLTTGIDFPAIDLILGLRPTRSTPLWVQMLGRGTRPLYAPGFDIWHYHERMEAIRLGGKRNCLVLDYAGNTKVLGPINDPVLPRKKGEKTGDAPIKICEMCGTYNHASARKCDGCGYEFPIQTKLKQGASTTELIKGEMPILEVFKVDHITYSSHTRLGSKPALRVTYYCGLRHFKQFVCFEHDNQYTAKKALLWWTERTELPLPATTDQALGLGSKLKPPTHLRVWTNKKYPEIWGYCFDGTAFGATPAPTCLDHPTMDVQGNQEQSSATPAPHVDNFDDDIPF
jgi:DNA repair protein RadD